MSPSINQLAASVVFAWGCMAICFCNGVRLCDRDYPVGVDDSKPGVDCTLDGSNLQVAWSADSNVINLIQLEYHCSVDGVSTKLKVLQKSTYRVSGSKSLSVPTDGNHFEVTNCTVQGCYEDWWYDMFLMRPILCQNLNSQESSTARISPSSTIEQTKETSVERVKTVAVTSTPAPSYGGTLLTPSLVPSHTQLPISDTSPIIDPQIVHSTSSATVQSSRTEQTYGIDSSGMLVLSLTSIVTGGILLVATSSIATILVITLVLKKYYQRKVLQAVLTRVKEPELAILRGSKET